MINVLVISRMFPVINQPWMDTYLEQLLKNKIDFRIYSYNKDPKHYNSKVDELGLRNHQIKFPLEKSRIIKFFLINLITKPYSTISLLNKFSSDARQLSLSVLGFIYALIKMLYLHQQITQKNQFDLCHSHTELGSFDFLFLCKAIDLPLVITFHGLPPSGVRELDEWKRKVVYESARAVFVNTEFAKRQVVSLGCPQDKVIILPQGTPLESFPFHANRPDPEIRVKLLTVGRYHRDKGHHYALLAIARLKRAGFNIEWNFVGVGPRLQALKELTKKLDIENNTIFHEALSYRELMGLYQNCHIFVLTSITNSLHIETQSVVIQESQASGCLVIATAVGGVPECVIDGENAFLIRPSSSRDIFLAVKNLYQEVNNWGAIRESARKHVESQFSADIIGEKMAKYLNKLAAK